MSTQQAVGSEGWRADPFGRHELRFFDGHKWTPYVRDGERNGLDEPLGVPAADGDATGRGHELLTEDALVVEHVGDHGRRRSTRAVHAGDGRRVGTLRTAPAPGRPGGLRSLVAAKDQFKGGAVELVDERDHLVLTLLRPIGAAKDTLVVRDPEGREVGRITETRVRTGATTYALVGPNGTFLGDVRSEDWATGEALVLDAREREVGGLSRHPVGLAPAVLALPDLRVVRLAQPLPEPLRTLVVAAGVGLQLALA